MIYKLATPAQFTDYSWITPGKVYRTFYVVAIY